ncbi:hypothetical protein EVAR_42498_1 [Eumeta japonica]|uniref:Uncharacterized protein n=1 Tax=Eumeta variegata TaxID=151549 RepID=A0A4C1XE35_EUMVA|nr:hypothetical protein EVAR_42498_1 [Eumeta japonica]
MTTRWNPASLLRVAVPGYRYIFILVIVFCLSFLFIFVNNSTEILVVDNEIIEEPWETHKYVYEEVENSFTIKTEGCTISKLRPFDDSIKKYVKYPTDMKPCLNSNTSLLESNETHIWVLKDNFYFHNISDDGNFSCCYKSFSRPDSVSNINSKSIDDRVQYDECILFTDIIEVLNEFVRVICVYQDIDVFEQYFVFAPKKEFWSDKNFYESDPTEMPLNNTEYNVLIMGIDAVSRMNFHRTMPKTLAYLNRRNAIELLGYNKVGDNTFPNVIPLLMGIREFDLKKTCLPRSRSTFDNCPFVWDWFKEAGFYTALGEDTARLGTFNYFRLGFSGSPTDYYLYTFMHESEKNVGNNKDFNSYLCMGNKFFYRVLLDYIQSLTATLKNNKLFGFFWEVTMSHDYLNYPMVMDDSYESFFRNLESTGYLDQTVVILLSDHGIRWGDIRSTKQGRLEERLPFVFVLLPPSLRESYETATNNLQSNARRLTTPFDLHATLLDLVNMNALVDENVHARTAKMSGSERGISLFLPVPRNRTCATAGIDEHWCTCHTSRKVPLDSAEATDSAQRLIAHVNTLVRGHKQCAQLTLDAVLDAAEVEAGTAEHGELGWREFVLVVRAKPGGAIFESTLRRESAHWAVSGSVSRLNLYGEQSRCVYDYSLKLYCFCG